MSEPEYALIQQRDGPKPCANHPVQKLVDVYNDPDWDMIMVATDKVQFTCNLCQSERVYQLMPEKSDL